MAGVILSYGCVTTSSRRTLLVSYRRARKGRMSAIGFSYFRTPPCDSAPEIFCGLCTVFPPSHCLKWPSDADSQYTLCTPFGGIVKVLLLEKISGIAADLFVRTGFTVETVSGALDEAALLERIAGVSVLGVRSKTPITRSLIERAPQLLAIGAFCIGVDRIDRGAC